MSTIDIEQRTPEWYAARRDWIGSSDAPVIAGESPYKSPLELWAEKTGQREPEPESDVMATGTLMEPVLAALYTRKTGATVLPQPNVYTHADRPWMTASLDGLTRDGRIVELKWTNASRWRDGLPFDVNLQVQHQMAVTGLTVADVAVLRGPTFEVIEVPRDETVIDQLYLLEYAFHQCVVERRPPTVDGTESTRRTLAALHPVERLPLVTSDADWEELAKQLAAARGYAKEYAGQVDTLENAARAMLGDTAGVAGNGWEITWTKNADSRKVDWQALARQLGATPEEIERFSEVKPGPRVLRVKGL